MNHAAEHTDRSWRRLGIAAPYCVLPTVVQLVTVIACPPHVPPSHAPHSASARTRALATACVACCSSCSRPWLASMRAASAHVLSLLLASHAAALTRTRSLPPRVLPPHARALLPSHMRALCCLQLASLACCLCTRALSAAACVACCGPCAHTRLAPTRAASARTRSAAFAHANACSLLPAACLHACCLRTRALSAARSLPPCALP